MSGAGYEHWSMSGGRSSAYMVHRLLEERGGLPAHCRIVFANTGKERAETLDFIARCEVEWGVSVDWLEYRDRGEGARPRHDFEQVDYATASRDGQPFEQMVRAKRRLPSPLYRLCTSELKIRTIERFLTRGLGWPKPGPQHRALLGLRWDEPKRWRKALYEECVTDYPMVHWKTTREDVLAFWRRMPFDLALPDGVEWSNCDLCFLKRAGHLRSIARREPGRLKWWEDLEREAGEWRAQRQLRKPEMAQWNPRIAYADLADGAQGALALDETEQLPCYCTD